MHYSIPPRKGISRSGSSLQTGTKNGWASFVSPDEILIINGSQQGLDLIGKVLIGAGDHVAIERPGYLGAIQAFSLYEPVFHPVTLQKDGPDIEKLDTTCRSHPVRLFYGVPNSKEPVRDLLHGRVAEGGCRYHEGVRGVVRGR